MCPLLSFLVPSDPVHSSGRSRGSNEDGLFFFSLSELSPLMLLSEVPAL